MELDWSVQSPHIRTLYRPWQPGDGYDEATLQAAEARLGVRLPATLCTFYQAWGKRPDLTRAYHVLLNPDELLIRAGVLIFWVEDQAVWYWGVRREALEEEDPPVLVTPSGRSGWEVASELDWTASHPHLSSLLDDLTYLHAFSGGAIHGGWTEPYCSLSLPQRAWLEEHWNKAAVTACAFGIDPTPLPTLYVRDGQAFWSFGGCSFAAREAEAVDEIAQRFHISWVERW